jgi:heme/copper-type cytochrome/quinol oxidase subunit 3
MAAALVERKLARPRAGPAAITLTSGFATCHDRARSASGAVQTGPTQQSAECRSTALPSRKSAMLAVLGSACTAFAILAIAFLALAFNHPNAPRWLQTEITVFVCAVGVTIVLGLGLGCLAVTGANMLAGGSTVAEVAALAGALALVVLVLRALKLGARLQGYQAAAMPLPPAV